MKARVIFLLVALLALTTGMQANNQHRNRNRRVPVRVERRYVPIRHNNSVYYYSSGTYYRQLPNRRYEVIRPYVGMVVPNLPTYRTVLVNGRHYYAYNNYLYTRVRIPGGFNFRVEMRF